MFIDLSKQVYGNHQQWICKIVIKNLIRNQYPVLVGILKGPYELNVLTCVI
jgi:hypothetical protein